MCVRVRLTNINTLSLTRDLCRSQLDLILISCFSLLLFFGKMFTQQARQIHIYKYVIKNSLRELLLRSTSRSRLSINILQRPEEMMLFARLSPLTPNQVVPKANVSFFVIPASAFSSMQLLIFIYMYILATFFFLKSFCLNL